MHREIAIEGISLRELREWSREDQDALLAFGRPIAFRLGSAEILAEFNRTGDTLAVNLAHIDGGGEGVLVLLWALIRRYAVERNFGTIYWRVHAATCAVPNPRLQHFLRTRGFLEIDDPEFGRIFMRAQQVTVRSLRFSSIPSG